MPIISVPRQKLFDLLGETFTDDAFGELMFDYGLELDDVDESDPKNVQYKIELPANRYDLLCLEGLSMALNVFRKKYLLPQFTLTSHSGLIMHVEDSVKQVRPYCVAAVLRNIVIDKQRYDSLIDLQDKLHMNIGRRRTLIAIGTHDLDTIKPPFYYKALPPTEIKFIPLNQTKEMNAKEMMSFYKSDSHIRQYLPIIEDKPVYPIIYDSNGVVLSMPPIINGDHTKITTNTKNVFIECTGTDLTRLKIVINTLVCMFTGYCDIPNELEQVGVIESDGSANHYPQLHVRDVKFSMEKANQIVGVSLSSDEIVDLLNRMCLTSKAEDDIITAKIPPTRADILHPCDIYEDIAIAYGYNNIEKIFPDCSTLASTVPVNNLTDHIRTNVAMAGYTEVMNFALCSRADVGERMCQKFEDLPVVTISNPKTLEFQVARTSLLPGILKTVASNVSLPLPLKLFEVSDVVLKDDNAETGARNERRLCVVYYNKTSGFELIHGVLDRVMQLLGVSHNSADGYHLSSCENPSFFPNRCTRIIYANKSIGTMGVLHPTVISNFQLGMPCSAFEISLEEFV